MQLTISFALRVSTVRVRNVSYSFRGCRARKSARAMVQVLALFVPCVLTPSVAHLKSRSKIEAVDVLGLAPANPKHPSHVWSRKQSHSGWTASTLSSSTPFVCHSSSDGTIHKAWNARSLSVAECAPEAGLWMHREHKSCLEF